MLGNRGVAGKIEGLERLRTAIAGETLPAALVDLDALDANTALFAARARKGGKRIRIASKSVRCPALMKLVARACGESVVGAMAYSARECAVLVASGFTDVLVAYPTVQRADLEAVVAANREGARASLVVDCEAHVDAIARAAQDAGVRVPVVVDVDVAYRPIDRVRLGVLRSPLRDLETIVALAERIATRRELVFHGVMAYEAHVAGVPDIDLARRAMKRLAQPHVVAARAVVVDALRARGLPPNLVNGGGTGSIDANMREATLTEVTVGSGFLASHLFDHYDGLALRPAAFFALRVARRPSRDVVTCHGGGWIASGAIGADRAPVPVWPPGLSLLPLEGAGEVQTPLRVPRGIEVAIGDAILFRHAKAGELAEHVREYALVRGDAITERVPTYRGLGECFLG